MADRSAPPRSPHPASVARRLVRWLRGPASLVWVPGLSWIVAITGALVVFCAPPAFVIGWVSRLSVLGMSRAREFSAAAAAVTLTGRPSALAFALLKLERQRDWTPRSDLREVEPYAVLCIVGVDGSRLFGTHPPVTARVKRLEAIELRIRGR